MLLHWLNYSGACRLCSWKDISQYLQGRSDNAIKNHWHSMRRRKHRLILESQALQQQQQKQNRGSGRVLTPSTSRGVVTKNGIQGIKTITPRGTHKNRSAFRKTSAPVSGASNSNKKKSPRKISKSSSSSLQQHSGHQNGQFGVHQAFPSQHVYQQNLVVGIGMNQRMDQGVDVEGPLSSKENLNEAFQGLEGRPFNKFVRLTQIFMS